eukprot:g31594.t1
MVEKDPLNVETSGMKSADEGDPDHTVVTDGKGSLVDEKAESSQTTLVGNGGIEGLDTHGGQEAVRTTEPEIVNMIKGIRGITHVGGQDLDKWRVNGDMIG